ncbi:hypothetical protein ACVQ8P_08125 [Dellaglioa sp. BT-FLS60]
MDSFFVLLLLISLGFIIYYVIKRFRTKKKNPEIYAKIKNRVWIAAIIFIVSFIGVTITGKVDPSVAQHHAESVKKSSSKKESESKANVESKKKAKAESESKKKAESESKKKAKSESKKKIEAKTKEESKAKHEAKLKSDAKEKAKIKAESKKKAESESKIKAKNEAKKKAESEAKAKNESKKKAESKAKAKNESKKNTESKTKHKSKKKHKSVNKYQKMANKGFKENFDRDYWPYAISITVDAKTKNTELHCTADLLSANKSELSRYWGLLKASCSEFSIDKDGMPDFPYMEIIAGDRVVARSEVLNYKAMKWVKH